MSRTETTVKYILFCSDFAGASIYAAERDWHPSWWQHLGGDYAPLKPVVYERNYTNEWLD
jgi:hypothetical protein